jgi:hypothetical protein
MERHIRKNNTRFVMKHKFFLIFIGLIISLIFLTGCGSSPLVTVQEFSPQESMMGGDQPTTCYAAAVRHFRKTFLDTNREDVACVFTSPIYKQNKPGPFGRVIEMSVRDCTCTLTEHPLIP